MYFANSNMLHCLILLCIHNRVHTGANGPALLVEGQLGCIQCSNLEIHCSLYDINCNLFSG